MAPHLVLLPSLGIGHLMPLLELSKRLAARGFIISLVVSHHHAPFALNKLMSTATATAPATAAAAASQSLDIRIHQLHLNFTFLPQHNNLSTNTKELAPLVALSQTLLKEPFEKLLEQMFNPGVDGLPPPLCIFSDFFLDWTVEVAAKFGIPRINVECSPPYSMNLVEALWTNLPRNLPRTASGRYIVPGQPTNPTLLSPSEMTPGLPEADETHPKHLTLKRLFPTNQQGSLATVCNTFYELEGIHIDHFQTRYAGPVRAIGPLLPYEQPPASAESAWLDSRSPGSVVYVSFGSENSITCAEMNELALGLEASGSPFLWVLRPPSDATVAPRPDFLPDGFCARTEQRGRILTGWANQLALLSHPGVGAFITHCGWNSALEGIACGVPFICWPLTAEQPFNAKFIVEEVKCGVRIEKGAGRDKIAEVINSLLDDDNGRMKAIKENARKWKEMAKNALCEGGSSAKNFDSLMHDILSL